LLADANILRAPLARFLSVRLDRPVEIRGPLHIDLFPRVRLEMNAVTVANAEWGSRPTMLEVERAVIGVQVLPLLRGRTVLEEVALRKPDVLLERNAAGEVNWRFGTRSPPTRTAATGPEIRSLSIEAGKARYRDPTTRSDVVVRIDSRAEASGTAVALSGSGRVRGREFDLEGRAASLLELTDEGKPYRLDVKLRAGHTRAAFDGTVVPLKLETIDGRVQLSGKDLSELSTLLPVALPWSSDYRVSAHLRREGEKYSLRDLAGRVGAHVRDWNEHANLR